MNTFNRAILPILAILVLAVSGCDSQDYQANASSSQRAGEIIISGVGTASNFALTVVPDNASAESFTCTAINGEVILRTQDNSTPGDEGCEFIRPDQSYLIYENIGGVAMNLTPGVSDTGAVCDLYYDYNPSAQSLVWNLTSKNTHGSDIHTEDCEYTTLHPSSQITLNVYEFMPRDTDYTVLWNLEWGRVDFTLRRTRVEIDYKAPNGSNQFLSRYGYNGSLTGNWSALAGSTATVTVRDAKTVVTSEVVVDTSGGGGEEPCDGPPLTCA